MRKKYIEERNGRSEQNMSFLQKLLTSRTRTFGHHKSSTAEYKIQVDVVGIKEEQNAHDACYE